MEERSWKILKILAVSVGIILAIIDYRWALGFLLGCGASVLTYHRSEQYLSNLVKARKGPMFLHFTLNYLIMAGVLILSAKLPGVFNIFACAAGLMIIKITAVIQMITERRVDQ
jgi:hypothetical protein